MNSVLGNFIDSRFSGECVWENSRIPDLKPFGVTHVSSFSSESNLCVKHCLQSASESASWGDARESSWKPGSWSSAASCILMSCGCSYNLILLIQACAGGPGGHSWKQAIQQSLSVWKTDCWPNFIELMMGSPSESLVQSTLKATKHSGHPSMGYPKRKEKGFFFFLLEVIRYFILGLWSLCPKEKDKHTCMCVSSYLLVIVYNWFYITFRCKTQQFNIFIDYTPFKVSHKIMANFPVPYSPYILFLILNKIVGPPATWHLPFPPSPLFSLHLWVCFKVTYIDFSS